MEVESVIRKYVPSRTGKRYEISRQGLGVVIKKLPKEETRVVPEVFSKPIPAKNVIKPTYMKPLDARKMLDEMAKNKSIKKEVSKELPKETNKENNLSNNISIPNFSNFKDIEAFVKQQQKENSEKNKQILKELKSEKVGNKVVEDDEQEDIDDLVSGNIQKEQKLINMEYLKNLEIKTLKRLFKMVTGFSPSNKMTKYEIRKIILEKYEQLPSSKKQLVYEASKLKDD